MAEHLTFEEMRKEYFKIFFALLTFTALTVFAANMLKMPESWGEFGHVLHIGIGLVIAFIKVSMVIYIFMHIKFDNKYLRVFIFAPLFFSCVLLFALTVLGL